MFILYQIETERNRENVVSSSSLDFLSINKKKFKSASWMVIMELQRLMRMKTNEKNIDTLCTLIDFVFVFGCSNQKTRKEKSLFLTLFG